MSSGVFAKLYCARAVLLGVAGALVLSVPAFAQVNPLGAPPSARVSAPAAPLTVKSGEGAAGSPPAPTLSEQEQARLRDEEMTRRVVAAGGKPPPPALDPDRRTVLVARMREIWPGGATYALMPESANLLSGAVTLKDGRTIAVDLPQTITNGASLMPQDGGAALAWRVMTEGAQFRVKIAFSLSGPDLVFAPDVVLTPGAGPTTVRLPEGGSLTLALGPMPPERNNDAVAALNVGRAMLMQQAAQSQQGR